jgi:hypothetical protein
LPIFLIFAATDAPNTFPAALMISIQEAGAPLPAAPPGKTKGSDHTLPFFMAFFAPFPSIMEETPVEGASGGFFYLLRTRC